MMFLSKKKGKDRKDFDLWLTKIFGCEARQILEDEREKRIVLKEKIWNNRKPLIALLMNLCLVDIEAMLRFEKF